MALWRLNQALKPAGSRLFLKEGEALPQAASSGDITVQARERGWLEGASDEGGVVAVWEQARNAARVSTDLAIKTSATALLADTTSRGAQSEVPRELSQSIARPTA
jgi:hypothetical protein